MFSLFNVLFAMMVCLGNVSSSIQWNPPPSFDRNDEALGLPELVCGVEHEIIFDPLLSAANTDLGGDGVYEGLQYGMFNHDARLLIYQDKFIVYWFSHATDENGPGARVLAKVGTFSSDLSEVDWGGPETLAEIVPPPALVKSRLWSNAVDIIDENFAVGAIRIIDDRLYVNGEVQARNGWVNDPQYGNTRTIPVPAENWSDSHGNGFLYDVGWRLQLKFYQAWKIEGDTIVPDSPMYCCSDELDSIEVTPGRFKSVVPSVAPYQSMEAYSLAPELFRDDIENGVVTSFLRHPKYASGTSFLAADGLNGLSHSTEFCRPDGKWVVVRDNQLNKGCYYAVAKDTEDAVYPPAYLTDLYGGAWADAGELPDGQCYIICNSLDRRNMFITVSDDGITFDRSWLLLHAEKVAYPGIGKTVSASGPQYFKSVVVGDNLWIVYSIAKEQIGVTKVPVSSLNLSRSQLSTWWSFDEEIGSTIIHDSIRSVDGSFGNGGEFAPSTAGVDGSGLGNAADFSSYTAPYVTFGAQRGFNFGTNDFTMTGWLKKPETLTTDPYGEVFINQDDDGGIRFLTYKGSDSRGIGRFVFGVDGKAIVSDSEMRLDDDQWHWFACVVSGGVMSMFVDGVKQSMTAVYDETTTANPASPLAKLGRNFYGQLDDIRFYFTALDGVLDGNVLAGGELYDIWRFGGND